MRVGSLFGVGSPAKGGVLQFHGFLFTSFLVVSFPVYGLLWNVHLNRPRPLPCDFSPIDPDVSYLHFLHVSALVTFPHHQGLLVFVLRVLKCFLHTSWRRLRLLSTQLLLPPVTPSSCISSAQVLSAFQDSV